MPVEFLQEILDKFIKHLDVSKEATKLKDSLEESQNNNKNLTELLEKTKNLVETLHSNSKDLKKEFFKQYNDQLSGLNLKELNDELHDSTDKDKEASNEPEDAPKESEAANEPDPLKEPESSKETDAPKESDVSEEPKTPKDPDALKKPKPAKERKTSKKIKASKESEVPEELDTSKKTKASKESEVPNELETSKKLGASKKPDAETESEQLPQDENCNLGSTKKRTVRKDSSEVESSVDPLENLTVENNLENHKDGGNGQGPPEVNGDTTEENVNLDAEAPTENDIKSPEGKPFKFGIKLVDINKLVEPKTAMRSPDASKYPVKKTVQFDSSVILISTSSDDSDSGDKRNSKKRRKSLEKEKYPKRISLVIDSSDNSSEDSQDEDFVISSKKKSKRDSSNKKNSPKKTLPSRRSKENAIKINKKLQKLDKIASKKHKKQVSSGSDSSSLSELSDSEDESLSSYKKNSATKRHSNKESDTSTVVDGYDWHSDVKFKSKCVINVLRVPCEEMKEYYGNKQEDLEVSRLIDKKTLKRRRQKSSDQKKSGENDSSASASPTNSTDDVDKSKAKKSKLSDKTSADKVRSEVAGSDSSKANSSDEVDKTDTADKNDEDDKTKGKDEKANKKAKSEAKKAKDGKKIPDTDAESSSDKDEDDLGSDGLPDFCRSSSPLPSPIERPPEASQNGDGDDATAEMADLALDALSSDKEDVSNSDSDKDEEDKTEKETTKKKKSKKKSKDEESDDKPQAEDADKSEENKDESKKDEATPENEKLPTEISSKDEEDKEKEDKDKGDKDKDEEKAKSDKESDVELEETPKRKKKYGEAKKDDENKKSKFDLSDTDEDVDKVGENKDKDKKDAKSDDENEDSKKEEEDEDKSDKEDDNKDKKKRKMVPSWKKDKLLTTKISSSDSEEESKKFKKKKKALKEASDKSDSEEEISTRKTRQRNKGKKKTIVIDSDSDNDKKSNSDSEDMFKSDDEEDSSNSSNEGSEKENENKKTASRKRIRRVKDSSSDDNEEKSTRKQIRGIWGRDSLAETTKKAEAEERERKARIAEKQKKYNQIYDIGTDLNAKVDKIILDFDEKTKKGLIKVHKKIVAKMKPHQAAGVQFMWDACFESLERAQSTPGSGCILAHCMGLGKTLQVIALTHTLLVNYEKTKVKKVMVVCPLNTVLNWVSEYKQWLPDDEAFEVFELVSYKQNYERQHQIKEWHNCGGVLIIGYDMYRNLSNPDSKRISKKMRQTFQEALVDPGPDLVVCDEGHLLKNEKTNLSIAMNRLKTLRRIVLTGTPLQNNMKEYFCMVQFIKPNLLGTYREYLNRFVNPITNGQYTDSTPHDIQIMRKRSHVLHKMLDGVVQRRDYSVLQPYLPPKHEYVLFLNLTEVQINLYEHYMTHLARTAADGSNKTSFLFIDFQNLQRICTHPRVLLDKSIEERNAKDLLDDEESESEGSLKDFIDDEGAESTSDDSNTSSSDNSDSDDKSDTDKKKSKSNSKKNDKKGKSGGASGSKANNRGGPRKRLTRAAVASAKENNEDVEFMDLTDDSLRPKEWWQTHCDGEELDNIMNSSKLFLLFEILKECEQIGDKVLLFSQSLYSLNVIEYFLGKIHDATQEDKDMCGYTGSWCLGLDYFRLDGSSSCDNRSTWCKTFNNPKNTRARLFLISTRAGGLGINLVAANRVIIFDVSWNPSHDIQSIYRVYRFGQTKPSYIYRFVTYGTMEMKIYERQVTKQAISKRVIDEQQIDRHYNQNDLTELYKFEPRPEDRPIPLVPKDVLLGELLQKHEDRIFKYHEHQSLLENKAEECLNEEERKAAWEEFEHEKTVRAKTAQPNNFMAPPAITAALMSLVKRDNPGWTDNQVRAIIPALTVQLQEQVAAGDLTMYQRVTKEIRYLQQLQNQRMREQYLQQQALRMFQQQQAMVNGGMVFNPAVFQNLNMPGTSQMMPRASNNPTIPNEVIDLND